ncbi:MAG: hypothetical protein KDC98_01095 [Planctomycetes bacterium]|nr:hypothetical protein [Planctomycetota bacterium]
MAFHTTRWSLIARAGGDDSGAVRALDELCRIYWPAVYAMYRGEGLDAERARDLTQGLFAHLLERRDLGKADRDRGRFRSFLRACARHWLIGEREREHRHKRGGKVATFSLDVDDEERRRAHEPVDRLDPAALFERRWAQAVIEQALQRLEDEELAAGRGRVFARIRSTLAGEAPAGSWAGLAAELGTTEGALRVAAHRLRQRFRQRLAHEVRDTLALPEAAGEDGCEDDTHGAELAALLLALRA